MRPALSSLVIALSVSSCASRQAPPNHSVAPAEPTREVVFRRSYWEILELTGKDLGRVEVIVRVADQPSMLVNSALVSLRPVGDKGRWKQVQTNQHSLAIFDSIPVGRYDLLVRALGYEPAQGQVTVSSACRTDVEAYIWIYFLDFAGTAPEPGRVRVTTCRAP